MLSAVQIASLFFPEDTYLGSSEGKGSLYPNESYRAGKLDLTQYGYASSDVKSNGRSGMSSRGEGSIFEDMRQVVDPDQTNIVILTNRRTASASEFLAGVFQDLDKGVVIGNDSSTLGKGIGQREMALPYGRGALKLTYHEFHTPSGRCVQRQHQVGAKQSSSPVQPDRSGNSFYTVNGRVLRDRNGIEVDYKAEPKVSLLSQLLSSSGAYFEFATDVCSRYRSPPNGGDNLVVDDRIYDEFRSYVLKEQRKGDLKLDEMFDDQHLLEKIDVLSIESGLHESRLIPGSVANVREKIVQDLLGEFDSCRDIISNELEKNILAHQLSDGELIGWSLKSDELVNEAVNILVDTNRHEELLGKPISTN